jgi:hypothetical protein
MMTSARSNQEQLVSGYPHITNGTKVGACVNGKATPPLNQAHNFYKKGYAKMSPRQTLQHV